MYKFVIFDIDGTLMDTEKAILCALQKLLKTEKNLSYKKEELQFVLGIPGQEALKLLNAQDISDFSGKWNYYLKDYVSHIRIFPEIEKTLLKLHQAGIKTGIVTSKTKQEFANDFTPFGLNHYFGYVVCADDTKLHKPNPEPLLKCLNMASEFPQNAIYIGDTIYDKQCADSANVDFALALWGAHNKAIEAKYRLSDPSEILNILNIGCKNYSTL